MPFHRQQPATASKLGTVYEHEGMSLSVCAELQLDNSTVTRCFNACLSPSRVVSFPRCLSMWSWLDLELLVGCRLFTGLTLISVSYSFDACHVLCVFVLSLPDSTVSLCLYSRLHTFYFGCNSVLLQLYSCAVSVSDPPQFSPDQPTQVQVVEDDMATIPLLVSANPEEVSCVWRLRREKLVKGDPRLCDGSINQVLVELSQQVCTQLCHSGSE